MMEWKSEAQTAFVYKKTEPRVVQERKDVGPVNKYNKKLGPETSTDVIACRPDGPGYIGNTDRFRTDFVTAEHERRQQEMQRKQQQIEKTRQESMLREAQREANYQLRKKKEAERIVWLQNNSQRPFKNISGCAYEIISQTYVKTASGHEQQKVDDMVRYRAQMRTRNLMMKGGASVPYDILSGLDVDAPPLPSRVICTPPRIESIKQPSLLELKEHSRVNRAKGPF